MFLTAYLFKLEQALPNLTIFNDLTVGLNIPRFFGAVKRRYRDKNLSSILCYLH